jgi:hypothetical protein
MTAILYLASSYLVLVFVPGQIFKQIFILFIFGTFFHMMKKFISFKVYEISKMAEKQQYSYVDFILMVTAFFCYAGFFGLYLYLENFTMLFLLLATSLMSGVLFFLFFYFNDLWLKKVWLYVFVLALIVLEVTWAISYWPNGLLGRGIVLFFAYYLLSGLGKHYLKESFSSKVLREYLFAGVVTLLLVLTTAQWKY